MSIVIETRKRYRYIFIDYLKGILIVLVILGHLLPGSVQENFARYLIYSFHMPLFLFISGYLLTENRLENYTIVTLAIKYLKRILFPWLVAFAVFMWLRVTFNQISIINWKQIIYCLLYPWYHLWFIPALFGMIVFLFVLKKLKVNLVIVLLISFLLTILWSTMPHDILIDSKFFLLGDKRLYRFFCFFCFGYCLRNKKLNFSISRRNSLIVVLLFLTVRILSFFLELPPVFLTVIFICMNVSLMIFVFSQFETKNLLFKDDIVFMGVNSLPLYLWHILPIWLMRTFEIDIKQPILFYLTEIIFLIAFVGFLKFVRKKIFLKTILLGSA